VFDSQARLIKYLSLQPGDNQMGLHDLGIDSAGLYYLKESQKEGVIRLVVR
jgi:hypothetical protein